MGQDTIIMEWEQLIIELANAEKDMLKHLDYMKLKGFIIEKGYIITPEGEIICHSKNV